ncbi:hypothetical protein DFH06DRAFT_1170177, partial [Mycena polygramma]
MARPPLGEVIATKALEPFTIRYLGPLVVANLVAAQPGRYLKAAHTSSITLSSAVAAHRPIPGFSSIMGVPGAIEALSRGLAVDLAPIRVNVIIVGAIESELLYKMLGGNADAFKSQMLTKELGTPEGAAEAYLFCMCSALATGQGFVIDNGALI